MLTPRESYIYIYLILQTNGVIEVFIRCNWQSVYWQVWLFKLCTIFSFRKDHLFWNIILLYFFLEEWILIQYLSESLTSVIMLGYCEEKICQVFRFKCSNACIHMHTPKHHISAHMHTHLIYNLIFKFQSRFDCKCFL